MNWSYSVDKETQKKRTRALQEQTSYARVLWNRAPPGRPSSPLQFALDALGHDVGCARDDQLADPGPATGTAAVQADGKGSKIDLFGLDTLVNMAVAAGLHVEMRIAEAT